jgi:hypothetical protein
MFWCDVKFFSAPSVRLSWWFSISFKPIYIVLLFVDDTIWGLTGLWKCTFENDLELICQYFKG